MIALEQSIERKGIPNASKQGPGPFIPYRIFTQHQPLKSCVVVFQTFREYGNALRANMVIL
jgi:hypothetical protein